VLVFVQALVGGTGGEGGTGDGGGGFAALADPATKVNTLK